MQENRSSTTTSAPTRRTRLLRSARASTLPDGRRSSTSPTRAGAEGYLLPFHFDTPRPARSCGAVDHHAGRRPRRVRTAAPMTAGSAQGCRYDGLLHARRHPLPLRPRRRVHALRRLPLLGDRPTTPTASTCGAARSTPDGQNGGRRVRQQRAEQPGSTLDDVPRAARAGRRHLADLPEDATTTTTTPWSGSSSSRTRARPRRCTSGRCATSPPAGSSTTRSTTCCPRSPGWWRPRPRPSTRTGCRPPAPSTSPAKLDAIASNPDVWAKTAFILTYDENDGQFDHVRPIVPPPGTPGEFVDGLPVGLGFRVPTIVVSPWTTGGFVCSRHLRPHLPHPPAGAALRCDRAQHLGLAPQHRRRPDLRLPLRRGIRPYPADPRLRYEATTASLLVAQREAQNKPAPMPPTGKAAVAQRRPRLRKLPSTTLH